MLPPWRHRGLPAVNGGMVLLLSLLLFSQLTSGDMTDPQAASGVKNAAGDGVVVCPIRDAGHRRQNDAGDDMREMGHLDEAAACYREALAYKSDFPAPYFGLGEVASDRGNPEEARDMFLKAIELWPAFKDGHRRLGMVYSHLGKNKLAVKHLKEALNLDRNCVLTYEALGSHYLSRGTLKLAAATYKESLIMAPDSPGLRYGYGRVLRAQGKYDECVEALKAAVLLAPDFGMAHNQAGHCMATKEDPASQEVAWMSFYKAAHLEPDVMAHHKDLIMHSMRMKKDPEEVLEEITFAAKSHPDNMEMDMWRKATEDAQLHMKQNGFIHPVWDNVMEKLEAGTLKWHGGMGKGWKEEL